MYEKVSWECIHITKSKITEESFKESTGINVRAIDIGKISRKDELLSEIARTYEFPDYFGNNWDALHDCLRELDNMKPAKGYILIAQNADKFIKQSTLVFGNFNEVWLSAAEYHAINGVSFHLVYILSHESIKE